LVDTVRFRDAEHAVVWFNFSHDIESYRGEAVVIEESWKMARSTFCELMSLAGVECPPPP